MEQNINNNQNKDQQQFVEIYEEKDLRAEKARWAFDFVQFYVESGLIENGQITIKSVPHRQGIGTGVLISGPFEGGEIFLSQEDISGLKESSHHAHGNTNPKKIAEMPSQAAFGWRFGTALDINGNEVETFVRRESF